MIQRLIGRESVAAIALASTLPTAIPASAQLIDSPMVAGGQIGQRQEREDVASIEPTGRVDSRIPNRVQSRLRNRIDRFYDPQANAASPYVVAGDQARARTRTGR